MPQDVCARLRARLEASGCGPVELRETHVSWVLLCGDRAIKLKKPVRFGFVDQSTLERRRAGCEAEVAVNRALAAGVVLGTRPVVEDGRGGLRVGEATDGPAVDWVVVMRRFDEAHTLAARLRAGRLPAGAVERVARRIAAFHSQAAAAAPEDWPAEVAAVWRRNVDELEPLVAAEQQEIARSARRFGPAFVRRRRAELHDRAQRGRVRDGHGDLRAEHVLIEGEQVTIVDRLEFDPALRRVDVADDLAFLLMDLESLGAADVAAGVLAGYRAAGGDPGGEELLAFFGAYRALVRAKVALLRGHRAERAAELLALAERLMWRARGPMIVVVSGPPASGKSTLAAELSRRSGLPVLSSDVVRKERLGLAVAARAPASAYAVAERAAVYGELGRRARAAGGVIVDATFGDATLREAFLAALGDDGARRLFVVECRAPPEVLAARAAARGAGASDAGPEVAARLAAAFSPFDLPAGRLLAVDAEQDADQLAARSVAWLDGAA